MSPQRNARPWQGQVEAPEPERSPPYDAGCYLCPGNERAHGARNPRYTSTFAFDNDFPALSRDSGRRPFSESDPADPSPESIF